MNEDGRFANSLLVPISPLMLRASLWLRRMLKSPRLHLASWITSGSSRWAWFDWQKVLESVPYIPFRMLITSVAEIFRLQQTKIPAVSHIRCTRSEQRFDTISPANINLYPCPLAFVSTYPNLSGNRSSTQYQVHDGSHSLRIF